MVSAASVDWRDLLTQEFRALGRWLDGRYVPDPGPDDEVVPATRFFDPDYLRSAIARAQTTSIGAEATPPSGDADPVTNLRIAVSRFTRQYAISLSSAVLVSLARGVGIDATPARCRLIMYGDVPFRVTFDAEDMSFARCAARPTDWQVDGPVLDSVEDLRHHVWRNLYADHLAPLLASVRNITPVAHNLIWNNAAEAAALVSDCADEYLGADAARSFVDDRIALLTATTLPGVAGPNPLLGMMDWIPVDEPDFPHGVSTRRHCCMTYLLPDRLGRLCGNCGFLPLEDRIALAREQRGVPLTAPQQGPARSRAIQQGLGKLRTRP